MKRTLFLLGTLMSMGTPNYSYCQQPKPLINSGQILEEARQLAGERKFKDAVAKFKQVSRSDTNYSVVLDDLASVYYSDSSFVLCMETADLGLRLFPDKAAEWYNLKANAVSGLGKKDEALILYDSALIKDPNKYLAWYNKGIVCYNLKKLPEARAAFEKTVLMSPYYAYGHYFLGRTAMEQGELVGAMLSFTTSLLVNPSGKYSRNAIQSMTELSTVTDNVVKYSGSRKPPANDPFEVQQEIMLSKVALDTKYKLQTAIEDPITRQLQALLEKMEFMEDSKDFFMQYYVPFYHTLFSEGKYDMLLNHIFSDLDIKSVVQFRKTHTKEMESFVAACITYLNTIRNTRVLEFSQRKNGKSFYYYDNDICRGKGPLNGSPNEPSFSGEWEFYHDNGALKSKGLFKNNKKEGEWVFYYPSGILRERSFFVNDTANGKSILYFDNGNINEDRGFINGKLDGESRSFYYSGHPKTIIPYKNGNINGHVVEYRSDGSREAESDQKDGKKNGKVIYYHPNGTKESEVDFVNDEAQGKVQRFYDNGVVEVEGQRVNNKNTGSWKGYYPSSKLREVFTYNNDELEGEYTTYYENGKLKEKYFYTKGALDKKCSDYDENGILYCESVYVKGKLEQLHYFDKKGVEFSGGKVRDAKVVFYDAGRKKVSEGFFNKNAEREGKTFFFYGNGKVSTEAGFKEGKQMGASISYDKKGDVTEKSFFTENDRDGYTTTYHENGQVKSEGWYMEGNKQGPHYGYDQKGNLIVENYYKNDLLDGYSVYYDANGKINCEQLFDEGWLTKITQFDSTGKMMAETRLIKGTGEVVYLHNNGKQLSRQSYQYYSKNGKSEYFFFDGTPNVLSYYKNGEPDSSYREYYYGNMVKTEGAYKNGKRTGTWKHYYDNGTLNYEELYVNGETKGKIVIHNEDGTVDKETNYNDDGVLDGPTTYFADSGKVALVLNYRNGTLASYTYEGPDGKLVAPVPLAGATGQVTSYFRNGVKSAEITFFDNMVNGSRKLYFSNGKPYVEGTRVMDSENGVKKIYHANGQLAKEENYLYDRLQGVTRIYYPDGKLKREENWYQNELTGPIFLYDKTGKLSETRFYYYNTLQSVK